MIFYESEWHDKKSITVVWNTAQHNVLINRKYPRICSWSDRFCLCYIKAVCYKSQLNSWTTLSLTHRFLPQGSYVKVFLFILIFVANFRVELRQLLNFNYLFIKLGLINDGALSKIIACNQRKSLVLGVNYLFKVHNKCIILTC